MTEHTQTPTRITLDGRDEAVLLFGNRDQHLKLIREAFPVQLVARGDTIQMAGDEEPVTQVVRVVDQLRHMIAKHGEITPEDVRSVLSIVQQGVESDGEGAPALSVITGGRGVKPRTDGQSIYVRAIQQKDLVLCIGPAGSGKTYLAVALAVSMLRSKAIRKIILVRPAVEAGERLGYLPGDLTAKINPYLRPLFDALGDFMEPEQLRRYIDNDVIEILPLAYMRGRTLNNALIILDEGQNATASQMKMFLTRMGNNSKIIVTGDITQIDLPKQTRSGLVDAAQRLRGLDGVGIVYLNEKDIVRHPLVQQIVRAYEETEKGKTR